MRSEDIVKVNIDDEILSMVLSLGTSIDLCRDLKGKDIGGYLRKAAVFRAVNSSLAIEGNNLSYSDMVDLINGKEVAGYFDEIVETRNATSAYKDIPKWSAWNVDDFLDAFDTMMFGLVEQPGFRESEVGIFEGERLIYRAPDHTEVPGMVERLFDWCSDSELPEPVLGAVAHFHIESIHPFADGNGRMGRLWNTKVMVDSDPVYGMTPMETYIRRRQDEYYRVLEESQHKDGFDCTRFVKFCLGCSIQAFDDLSHIRDENMMELLGSMGDEALSLKEIMSRMGYGSRDKFMEKYIRPALDFGLISRTEENPNNRYQKYRRMV